MRLSSPSFQNNTALPTKYAHPGVTGGKNLSLPLSWADVPAETRSFAVSIIDPHPVARNWVHWFVINIPRDTHSLSEGASGTVMPPGSKELFNSYGEQGYGGPEPPKGSGRHPYVTTVYALSVDHLDLSLNATRTAFEQALSGNIIASAAITGFYER
ncbi:MAG TPA: YbhB/YbcL family Raf kinase inhibitor-like protein [Bacteroidota bacterium]|nr:YbhB/YbcL family Raf kinase inhibitor-like protein [Bacteroidota bacterium]